MPLLQVLIFVLLLSDRYFISRYWLDVFHVCVCRWQIESRLPHSEKLRQMVYQGVPHSIRSQIWMRTTGALEKKLKSEMSYKVIVKTSSNDHLMTSKQIEKVHSSNV